ncbi:hypothetical protein CFOL_v3_18005 [Cephalotus follicularis]|uniref:Uncharacterized protein n=1 Tax=Cephalotus follicularis TaxID=3775 RepID=A0A1Q3C2T3_CEPFO|nr:hypothetical protein CFOL_v3_18005 [Cephalotus follicularis]
MWAVSPILTKPPLIPFTNPHPPRHPQNLAFSSSSKYISSLNCSPKTPNPTPKREDKESEGRELSGSDVLWALHRATANKKSKNNKRRKHVSSSVMSSNTHEDGVVDYTNVRPLRIKMEWGVKLNDLEKRLQELSQ